MENLYDEYDDSWFYNDEDPTDEEELEEFGFHDVQNIVDDPLKLDEEDWDEEDE